MDEEGSRLSTGYEFRSTLELANRNVPLIEVRSEMKEMLHGERLGTTHMCMDPVVAKGESLAQDVVLYLLGKDLQLVHQDQPSLSMRSSVVEMLDKHAILFASFAKRLASTPEITLEAFGAVCDELFLSGGVTWSRIIALYALAGRLAVHYQEENMHTLARSIPQYMTDCIIEKIAPFVKKNGGWEQLCVEFPLKEDLNGKVWRCLLFTGAGLGIVAALLAVHS